MRTNSSGQAMVEFIVGIVAVLVLFAGILQIATMARAHTRTLIEARTQAGSASMQVLGHNQNVAGDPDYIRDWQPGADNRRYTPDDLSSPANSSAFDNTIVDPAGGTPEQWAILSQIGTNRIGQLHGYANPEDLFGLVRGTHTESVEISIPAARHLITDSDSVDISTTVWMTWTRGIY